MSSADGFEVAGVLRGEEEAFTAGHVPMSTTEERPPHRCVAPLPGQVLWLRWVGHPGRAAVRGGRRHHKVVRVARAVG